MNLDSDIVARVVASMSAHSDVELVVLFGSSVDGHRRPNSDVDVAVMGTNAADLDRLYLALAPALEAPRLDLVDLRRAGPVLAFEIARKGQVLYERTPGTFRRFQSLASRRYADTKKLRDAQRHAIRNFVASTRA